MKHRKDCPKGLSCHCYADDPQYQGKTLTLSEAEVALVRQVLEDSYPPFTPEAEELAQGILRRLEEQ